MVAQFFNIAAQVCTWTYIIQYVQDATGGSLQLGSQMLQLSLIVFLIARFVMTWVIGHVLCDRRSWDCSAPSPSCCASTPR